MTSSVLGCCCAQNGRSALWEFTSILQNRSGFEYALSFALYCISRFPHYYCAFVDLLSNITLQYTHSFLYLLFVLELTAYIKLLSSVHILPLGFYLTKLGFGSAVGCQVGNVDIIDVIEQ